MSYSSQHSHALIIMSTQNPSIVEDVFTKIDAEKTWLESPFAFEIYGNSAELNSIKAGFTDLEIDIQLVETEGRRKKFLISDMDSTLIHQECIDEIAAKLNLREQVSDITERAMRGELDFELALRERVGLLKGIAAAKLEEVWKDNITLMEGAEQAVKTMKKQGAYCLLVSGGFTFFSSRVMDALGFDDHQANTLIIENDALNGQVTDPILGQEAKLDALMTICEKQNITPEETLAIGDGANDLKMITASGMGIAYHAKPAVQEASQYALNHTDLRGLLYLQGYTKTDFAL